MNKKHLSERDICTKFILPALERAGWNNLMGYDRFAKTIVFCVDIDHAERMRTALARHNADLVAQNHKYIMQML